MGSLSKGGSLDKTPVAVEQTDLSTEQPADDVTLAVHDGSGTEPAGLYWYDEANTRWVKVSTEDTSNSTTIGISI